MIDKGIIVCSIAPTAVPGEPVNPRNSEGSFIRTTDGRILFTYTRFEDDNWHDDANSDIACIESSDEGLSWSDYRVLFRARDLGVNNIMSTTLLRMQNGDIGLFVFHRLHDRNSKYVLYRSADEGYTWSEPTECINLPGYYVVINDRVLRLSDGRLIIPAAYHPPMPDTYNRFSVTFVGVCRFFISDDDGFTWRPTPSIVGGGFNHTETGLQEPGLTELSNGVLWAYARTDQGRQYEYFSFDRGETWTAPRPSAFFSPPSPMLIRRNPYDGKLYAIRNPFPNYPYRDVIPGAYGRTPFALSTSDDDGKTWSEPLFIEEDPAHGYCYPALHFERDYLLLSYCSGSRAEDGNCLNRTTIRRIELS